MRYVHDKLVSEISGLPFVIDDPDAGIEPHEATIGELIALCLDAYDQNHMAFAQLEKQSLSPKETRAYNLLLDMLAAPPPNHGYYSLEGDHHELAVKLVDLVLPRIGKGSSSEHVAAWRHHPYVQEYLKTAPTKLPEAMQEPVEAAQERES